ncbi:hypothetical protein ACGFNU_47065 [Spirillospora sp. NPDC048911]|uniref:hypothetical protein n=1 Tax=Spirillospora sp. NPDC048911 TaxID=3364527 RepID=UPI00371226C9
MWIRPDADWQLGANTERTAPLSIYAPATGDGAREVAQFLHGLLHRRMADPFLGPWR